MADDLVRRAHDALGIRRVDRDLADGDVLGDDRDAGLDRSQRDDDGDLLEAALAGLLLGLVDEEEGGAARGNREDDPDDDDPPSTLGRILVFHFH